MKKKKKRIKKLRLKIQHLKAELRSMYFNSHQTHLENRELRKKLNAS